MKYALFIKHDGSTEKAGFHEGLGDRVLRDEIEYKAVALLYHPKSGICEGRILVPVKSDSESCEYKVFDGLRIKVR